MFSAQDATPSSHEWHNRGWESLESSDDQRTYVMH